MERKERGKNKRNSSSSTDEEQEGNPTSDDEEVENKKTTHGGILRTLVKKLDNRQLPKLEKFNEESTVRLEEYLTRFENYCKQNYKGGEYLWIGELEEMLTGRALEGFRTIRQNDEDYRTTRRKLLEWYEEERELRTARARKRFHNAIIQADESILLYSNRLLSLFKIA